MAENGKVVVLGAGLAGMSAAWVLRKNGYEVCLLEKAAHNGGLAVTKTHGEYRYDLGPHNIHTVHNHILTFLKRNFVEYIFEHNPTSKIFKRGKLIDYPLRGIRILTSLPLWKLPLAGMSFFFARLAMFLRTPAKAKDLSFQGWITNRFGRLLYGEYFGNYASKVWCTPGDQIDKYVAEKRVPVVGVTDLIRAALFGAPPRGDHPEFLDKNYYLRDGIGQTVEFFDRQLRSLGAEIRNEIAVQSVHADGRRVTAVTYTDSAGRRATVECAYLLSTIPLPELVHLIDSAPSGVREEASRLDYCATVLVFVKAGRRNAFPSKMLYFSDHRVKISRVYDVGSYSDAMVPEGKALYCAEVPCKLGDETWKADDEDIAGEVVRAFREHGLLESHEAEGSFVERITHSYPRFRLGFQERLKNCFEYLNGLENCLSYGRQGGFAYLNTDGVMHLGMRAAEAVIVAKSMGYSCPEWFEKRSPSEL